MGSYNNTTAQLRCPRCGKVATVVVDLYFGNTANMETVPIGSPYPFFHGREPHNGGPLTDENPHGMGYAECPMCGKDFHCMALIHNGVLTSITPDRLELPLIFDRELRGSVTCPECQSTDTRRHFFNGFDFSKLICDSCHSETSFRHDSYGNVAEMPVTTKDRLVRNK